VDRVFRRLCLAFGTAFLLLASRGPATAQDPPGVIPAPLPEGPAFSPRGAFLRSLVLPGWGQAYVEAPGRGAIYFALAGGSAWMAYIARSQLRDARAEQAFLRETGRIELDEETEFAIARSRHFEDWAALSIFLVFFSAADAYVSAYLADFDERIGVRPGPDGALRIEAQFPSAWIR
jgi:hypothetical protein